MDSVHEMIFQSLSEHLKEFNYLHSRQATNPVLIVIIKTIHHGSGALPRSMLKVDVIQTSPHRLSPLLLPSPNPKCTPENVRPTNSVMTKKITNDSFSLLIICYHDESHQST